VSESLPFINAPSHFSSRFADRDMLMRYHWGVGIGHTHAHSNAPATHKHQVNLRTIDKAVEQIPTENETRYLGGNGMSDSDESELGMEDRDNLHLDDSSDSEEEDAAIYSDIDSHVDDEEFLELHDTYFSG
jgi:hypothetical protein